MFTPYQQHVIEDYDELHVKVKALEKFIASAAFDSVDVKEQFRMTQQLDAMKAYELCLEDRISNFDF
ncbi:hypothetical protein [Erwinia phage Virsaitis27]|nr:hypothetical protein [Erwinia phage Virsaitis27]